MSRERQENCDERNITNAIFTCFWAKACICWNMMRSSSLAAAWSRTRAEHSNDARSKIRTKKQWKGQSIGWILRCIPSVLPEHFVGKVSYSVTLEIKYIDMSGLFLYSECTAIRGHNAWHSWIAKKSTQNVYYLHIPLAWTISNNFFILSSRADSVCFCDSIRSSSS